MTERLTDEELDLLARCFPVRDQSTIGPQVMRPTAATLVQQCIAELRERRAADSKPGVTEEEREALAWLREAATDEMPHAYGPNMRRALAVLDRLTGQKGSK